MTKMSSGIFQKMLEKLRRESCCQTDRKFMRTKWHFLGCTPKKSAPFCAPKKPKKSAGGRQIGSRKLVCPHLPGLN
jgi:hypothetical protein